MGKCNMAAHIIKDTLEAWGYDFKVRTVIMIMLFSISKKGPRKLKLPERK